MKLVKTALCVTMAASLVACGSGGGGSKDTAASSVANASSSFAATTSSSFAATTSSSASTSSAPATQAINLTNVKKVVDTNADIALAVYSDAVDTAVALQAAIATFKATPTQTNLDAAQKAWLVAREPYGQSEVYRFRLSPIDSTNYKDEDGAEGAINAWPLGEALIDYVKEGTDFGDDQVGVSEHASGVNYPTQNIINSSVVIDAALIANSATAKDEHDVISGYHALEFMLWGQDLNLDGSADTEDDREMSTGMDILNSGGHRPLTDFTTDQYAARRFQFLEVVAQKLVDDLTAVRDGWKLGATYRTAFTAVTTEAEAKQKLLEILTGMGTLSEGELAGERMQISFSSGSQEDEHSCFSDNTHRDIWLDAEGISNSYYGDYAGYDSTLNGEDNVITRAVNGYGLDDYLVDAGLTTLAVELKTAFTLTETSYKEIDASARAGTPVDNLIITNRTATNPMYKTIVALNAQATKIAKLAEALGIDGDVVDGGASECDTTNPTATCP
ncbi:MAG: imelysin family protein [Marinagarivorans sp.]|nr:imelysin family protein [Marinagarivorans sp.]